MVRGYSDLYNNFMEEYKKYNKYNKLRLVKKHCSMSETKSIKKFPRMRKMEHGTKVFTYKTGECVYFTCKQKQEGCSNYTLHKVLLILKQQGNRTLF